jgi:hypothetical protein
VYFKFGKVCYRLTVGECREENSSWWSSFFLGGRQGQAAASTAQAKIQNALGLSDEMKVRKLIQEHHSKALLRDTHISHHSV